MPNGADKNWVRLCAAIDGFRVKYGAWPTRVRIDPALLDDVRALFSPERWAVVEARVAFVLQERVAFQAEDDSGNLTYCYGAEGFPSRRPEPDANQWFGVEPDNVPPEW